MLACKYISVNTEIMGSVLNYKGNIRSVRAKSDNIFREEISDRSLLYSSDNLEHHAHLPAPLSTYSYRVGIPPRQQAVLNICSGAIGACGLLHPILTATALSLGLLSAFAALILLRFLLVLVGFGRRLFEGEPRTRHIVPEDLPVYSILIAAYQEAEMMEQLADALNALSWPEDRLEILILLEADDPETLQAARRANFSEATRFVIVPPGGPRTKPNALNHGLALTNGTFITVYDVEDLPHPEQLRHTYNAFLSAPDDTICVQAPLIAINGDASWMAAQWALEYRAQFGLFLPALCWLRQPVLLGGTSNHFRRDALFALGGWDAWNVTEDADLGMRIARAGLRIETIRTPTLESAPKRFDVWFAQRSRWLKGFLQTWLVLMRSPGQPLKQMGLLRFLVAQMTLGGAILAPLAHAPCVCLIAVTVWFRELELGVAGLILLMAGLSVGLLGDLLAPGQWTWQRFLALATRPLYWPLHSLAAYRAIWELADRPFFWAKTPHQPYDVELRSFFSIGS